MNPEPTRFFAGLALEPALPGSGRIQFETNYDFRRCWNKRCAWAPGIIFRHMWNLPTFSQCGSSFRLCTIEHRCSGRDESSGFQLSPGVYFENNATNATVETTDPGRALITGKWADIGSGRYRKSEASHSPRTRKLRAIHSQWFCRDAGRCHCLLRHAFQYRFYTLGEN